MLTVLSKLKMNLLYASVLQIYKYAISLAM